jgi:hypothetical protein
MEEPRGEFCSTRRNPVKVIPQKIQNNTTKDIHTKKETHQNTHPTHQIYDGYITTEQLNHAHHINATIVEPQPPSTYTPSVINGAVYNNIPIGSKRKINKNLPKNFGFKEELSNEYIKYITSFRSIHGAKPLTPEEFKYAELSKGVSNMLMTPKEYY